MVRSQMVTRLLAVERVLDPEAAMLQGRGLASLLTYAQAHPREPWDEDDASRGHQRPRAALAPGTGLASGTGRHAMSTESPARTVQHQGDGRVFSTLYLERDFAHGGWELFDTAASVH